MLNWLLVIVVVVVVALVLVIIVFAADDPLLMLLSSSSSPRVVLLLWMSFFHSIATHIRFSRLRSILYLKRKANSTKRSNNMDVKRRNEKAIEIATTIVKAGAVEGWNLADERSEALILRN